MPDWIEPELEVLCVCVCVRARARIVAQKVVAQENKFYNHSLCVRGCACECVCVCPTN